MSAPLPVSPSAAESAPTGRFVAWIDGVGAYLVCWGGSKEALAEPVAHIRIGGLSGRADVRVAANLGREHAVIHRSGEGYVVEANGPALVATDAGEHWQSQWHTRAQRGSGSGRVVAGRTNLSNGDELVLYQENSTGVRFRFRCPNALTATGVLSLASDHRTEPRFDGIILLAEACLLGPGTDSHIRCPEWPGTLVLFRRDDQIYCKSNMPSVPLVGTRNGKEVASVEGAIPVESGLHVTGPGISFRLEG